MSSLQNARARVDAILEEIHRLKQSEFPYVNPQEALDIIEKNFRWHQNVLKKTSPDAAPTVLKNVCRDSLRELYVYLPILGFILRATNVRNSFEAHGPLQRLAAKLMGNDKKLIVSSEWEYSPFVYRSIDGLSGFVLIGLPAPESSNPLLIPLAGHELGHSIWEYENFESDFDITIETKILEQLTNIYWERYSKLFPQYKKEDVEGEGWVVRLTWLPAYTWAHLQCEELFCDFVGLKVFEEAYLYAFAYVLSPGTSGQRPLHYPNINKRAMLLVQAAEKLGLKVPDGYAALFTKANEPTDPTMELHVKMADAVSASLVDELIDKARDFVESRAVPKKDPDKVQNICKTFSDFIVPTRSSESLVDILNAGWECNMDEKLWMNKDQIRKGNEEQFRADKRRVLRDLMLKSMEINEIYERLGEK